MTYILTTFACSTERFLTETEDTTENSSFSRIHIFEFDLNTYRYFRFFIPCIFYICYNKNYQQMRLFVLCLYFLFLVFSLHVSGLHRPIIRGISSCCFYATICKEFNEQWRNRKPFM